MKVTHTSLISAGTDAALLRALAKSSQNGAGTQTPEELGQCVRPFLPLLFTLAEQAGVTDRETAVLAMLDEIQHWCHRWEATGLPARAWVIGMAQKRLREQLATAVD
ncbi:hypothetical protein ACFFLM_21825 [Deinococcus oregonensis]|uniref:RNA polymerase subunit sigma n=1 Tax=Deinococcus oregonensis TaxID=1805970 RepID=A0ABV6B4B8_9DEIO